MHLESDVQQQRTEKQRGPGGGQLQDTGKARSARKAWEAAYDTHCGKYASERPTEMVQDMLWAYVAVIGI